MFFSATGFEGFFPASIGGPAAAVTGTPTATCSFTVSSRRLVQANAAAQTTAVARNAPRTVQRRSGRPFTAFPSPTDASRNHTTPKAIDVRYVGAISPDA